MTNKLIIKTGCLLFVIIALSGCQSLFFWPSEELVDSPNRFEFNREIVLFKSKDHTQLHGWFLPSKQTESHIETQGTVYFLHGNAQNLSYHIANLHWLTNYGWNVFVMDYRGYGRSQGEPDLKSIIDDAAAGYDWLIEHKESPDKVIVLGQSLGGAVAVGMLGMNQDIKVNGLIIDSSFTSHRKIFREIIGKSPILWAFQYPLSIGITDDYAPEKHIDKIKDIPILIVHSEADQLINKQHSIELYEMANTQKSLWLAQDSRHIAIWQDKRWQKKLVCQLQKWPKLEENNTVCQDKAQPVLVSNY